MFMHMKGIVMKESELAEIALEWLDNNTVWSERFIAAFCRAVTQRAKRGDWTVLFHELSMMDADPLVERVTTLYALHDLTEGDIQEQME